MTRTLLLCDCARSQTLPTDDQIAASGCRVGARVSALCMGDLAHAQRALGTEGDPPVIACAQEAPRFAALAAEMGVDAPICVDIRDRAGWAETGSDPRPKQAALLAEALRPRRAPPVLDITSEGSVLVLGADESAIEIANTLSDELAVTLLLPSPVALTAPPEGWQIIAGRLRHARGALGRFEVEIDALQMPDPAGRGTPDWSAPRDGAQSGCDIILDLRGGTPLFPADHKRDGYLRADPAHPAAVADAQTRARALIGTFEKPLHLRIDATLCAHSRAGQTGCTRCLDICPTGALVPQGDHVAVDPHICAGCGGCGAVCPSGAISYETPALPEMLDRLRVLAETYRQAGGAAPRLLVHGAHGAEMIRLAARFGTGLPADMLPFEHPALSGFGHAEILAALGLGFASVTLLPGPRDETAPMQAEVALARAMAGPESPQRVEILSLNDPDALPEALRQTAPPAPARPVLPLGNRRQIARLGARALGLEAPVSLPQGAPYGEVVLDRDACTLCLSCVSLCPSGALMDNPDRPQLRFQEDACLQCGICTTICPESALTLNPRFDPRYAALSARILHEEEPFACVECGAAFGTASTVQRILDKLSGHHPIFANSEQARMIQMCEDCRIQAQFARPAPMAMTTRRPRSTDDYKKDSRDE